MSSRIEKQNSRAQGAFKKFGNRIKSKVNAAILSSQNDIPKTIDIQIPQLPLTPIAQTRLNFPSQQFSLTKSTTSVCLKRTKSVKFDQTPISKPCEKSPRKKPPVSILKNSSLQKSSCSILSGSRNINHNSSFYSNAQTDRSRLSATDSVVEDQRQVMVEKNKYKLVMQNHQFHNKKFFDDLFPPGSSSIYTNHNSNKYGQIKWIRISQLFKNYRQHIYSCQNILKSDIVAGEVQIPYLVTCFQSLNQSIRCLERIFQDQKCNQTGLYCLRIFVNGIWKYVMVDDFIPTVKVNNKFQPLFLKVLTKKNVINIWPFLLQKAYAKIYSSYESLTNGNVLDFMNQLTGCCIQRLKFSNSSYFDLKKYYDNPQYLIIVGKTKDKEVEYVPTDNGRAQGFVPSFLSEQIITINSKQYEINEIINDFQEAIIAKIDETYYSVSCTIQQTKQSLSIRSFKLESTTFCDISLIQKDLKYFRSNMYKYSWIRVLICMKETQGIRFIAGGYQNNKTIHLQCALDPGEYYIVVIGDWGPKSYNFCLVYNGDQPITFQRKTLKQVPNVFEEACADIAQRFGNFKQLSTNLCSYRYVDQKLGLLIENLNNENNIRDVALIKSYGQVVEQVKMTNKIRCFDKDFISQKYTLTRRIKPKQHYTLVMMLPGSSDFKAFQYFVFDQ